MTSLPVAPCRISCNKFKRHDLKNKRLSMEFLSHFQIYIKFATFWKKNKSPNLRISEIIDCERCGT